MNKHNGVTDALLVRYLKNELDNAEQAMVVEWLKDEPNQQHFATLKAIWSLTAMEAPKDAAVQNAWNAMRQKVSNRRRTIDGFGMKSALRVAACLLLCFSIYAAQRYFDHRNPVEIAAIPQAADNSISQTLSDTVTVSEPLVNAIESPEEQTTEKIVTQVTKAKSNKKTPVASLHSKEEICNNTNCPLEICIVQVLDCEGKASTFAHCSLLQPDASGELHYKTYEGASCIAPVREIRIRRVTTGETIVLNEETRVTAQGFFDYLTGTKTGDVVAGIFEADCNNHCIDQSIKLDNRLGMPEFR